jgi:hypothetical protein
MIGPSHQMFSHKEMRPRLLARHSRSRAPISAHRRRRLAVSLSPSPPPTIRCPTVVRARWTRWWCARKGSVETPPIPAAPGPQEITSLQAPPLPAAPAAVKPTPAAATPAAAAAPTKYVVQVGSKKSQTDALASFADMQQKFPMLLANYRPMVQKADLGAKGTWYRLRIGPIADKTTATKLCSQLKSQGLPDCVVMAQ